MSRKCPECQESGRNHLPGCAYGPDPEERVEFIRANAVSLVVQLEEKVRRQAKELARLNQANECLRRLARGDGGSVP